MQSVAEAFAAAQARSPKYTTTVAKLQVTDAQVRYAMKVSYAIASRHYLNGAVNYEDLAMSAVERIMVELSEHEHLHTYNAWMGKVASWAIATELQRMYGRPGKTRQGKLRSAKHAAYSLDRMAFDGFQVPLAQEDHDLRLSVEDQIESMSPQHQATLRLMQQGYTYSEISRILGVTAACITLRVQAIRKAWPETCM